MEQFALRAGVGWAGKVTLEPGDHLLTSGDQRYAVTLVRDGKPFGNLFVVRTGRVVHTLTIGGLYLEKPESVTRLFAEPFAEAQRRFP
jgi:hypothetical protein